MRAMDPRREQIETEVRRCCDAGDLDGAATAAVEGYGPELLGFLAAVLRDDDAGAEVFAQVCAALWEDLPRFRWECALRTWLYTVAHHRLASFRRDPLRRRGVPLSLVASRLVARVRSSVKVYLRTPVKDQIARLRESLSAEDQTLLILRVDRDLSWSEVAQVMDVAEEALRKRFQRIKDRLRKLAVVQP
jgi:RNA polymerase sigma-70 factor, ECF subfamily